MTTSFSVIIPVIKPTPYLRQCLKHLKSQKPLEVLVITDKISGTSNPAAKRNLGAKMAKGKYLAFIDDDAYPAKNWLQNASKLFSKYPNLSAVCGPHLTPISDSIWQQASGLVWSSFLGSGGAGDYRNSILSSRFVDDYPTSNLIVKKTDFDQIGGFQTHAWPGEDTVLCLSLTKNLGKQILYHPSIKVFHHRRAIFLGHLKQIGRYGRMRGLFVKKYPQTSARPGFFLPGLFLLYLLTLPIHQILLPLYLYGLLLLITFFLFLPKNSLLLSLLATLSIPPTHVFYGLTFLAGFLFANSPLNEDRLPG